jgi:hypothetical protein
MSWTLNTPIIAVNEVYATTAHVIATTHTWQVTAARSDV